MASSLISPAHIGIPREGGKDVANGRRQNAAPVLTQINVAQGLAAISASFATVFMLRAVPDLAAGILSLERPMPLR